jgi:type II secretory pathway component PulF
MTAMDHREVLRRLADDGLTAMSVTPSREFVAFRGIRTHDLAVVFRNVATLVGSGVPVEAAIAASEGLVHSRLGRALADVRRLVREGKSVADALRSLPHVFPRSLVGVISAGEGGSRLESALESAAVQLEAEAELTSQVRSALAYPLLLLFMGIATIVVMGTVVVPRFAVILNDLGAELPASTRALLALAGTMRVAAIPTLLAGLVAIPCGRALLARPSHRERVDRLLLQLPVIGGLRLGFGSARTCRALGGMLSNGMPLLTALDAAAEASGDLEMSARLNRARSRVARGSPLTRALDDERALSPMALQLVGIGESSSRLGPLVSRAGDMSADRAERALRTAVALLEPLLVVALGLFIALAAAAILQAVYSVRPT